MKIKEIKKLSVDELKKKVNLLKKDLFNLRFRKVNGQIENSANFSTTKKDLYDYINSHKRLMIVSLFFLVL